jgi:23S rRNA (adenine2503-C2)-methyltransferase
MTKSPASLYDLKFDELQLTLQNWGEAPFRAKQIWEWLYVRLVDSYEAMTSLPKPLRDRLAAAYPVGRLTPQVDLLSADGWTRKILFALPDRAQIETVFMEYDTRNTVCVSTQAGCAMGCTFLRHGPGRLSTQFDFRRNHRASLVLRSGVAEGRKRE